MCLEICGIFLTLLHYILNSVQGLGLNLEGVVDLYFTEQKRSHKMGFHAFGLLKELS